MGVGDGSQGLWEELSALADGFAELGRGLLQASRLLHAPGVLPAESLLGEAARLRGEFASVRDRVCRQARALGVEFADGPELGHLKGLARLLELVSESEARRDAWAERASRALAVLDRVLALRHVQQPGYPALAACQDEARALRTVIAAGPDEALDEVVNGLAENDHPFAYLLAMVEGNEGVSDDLWESLFDAVGRAFGRTLAAAVARSKVVLGDTPAPAEAPAPPPAAAAAETPAPVRAEVTATPATAEPAPAPVEPLAALSLTAVTEVTAGPVASSVLGEPLGEPVTSVDPLATLVAEAWPHWPKAFGGLATLRRLIRSPRRKSLPGVERLERFALMSCNVISGYVFLDTNNDGLYAPSESPIAGNPVELKNASGQVVGTAVTDAKGFYEFSTDSTISTAPLTLTKSVDVPAQSTNFSQAVALPKFDASLGELTSVELTLSGTLTSAIRAENLSVGSPATIEATVAGTLQIDVAGSTFPLSLSAPAGTFDASPYDGTTDFQGTSGHTFPPQSATGSQTFTFSKQAGQDLSPFIGTGGLPGTFQANASSTATGGGNLASSSASTASATLTVRYTYTPTNCLRPGDYTIVQTEQPPGTLNGLRSRDGVVLPPTTTLPDVIPVTLNDADLLHNDFGELKPSSLAGYVYNDVNNNGVMNPGELGIAGVTVTLKGLNDLGQGVTATASTAGDGSYAFGNLRPGTYEIVETQPAAYLDGQDTIGTQGGSVANDRFYGILLPQDTNGVQNDFGELKPSSLAGYVYEDTNDNGVKNPGEPGIPGVTIALKGTDDLGAVVSAVTSTSGDGSYSFDNLRPGTYQIDETQPAGFLDGQDTIGTPGGFTGNDRFYGVVLPQGFDGQNNNFGELLPPPAPTVGGLSGYVYYDKNDDGIREPGEPGLANVPVLLTRTSAGTPFSLLSSTDANGFYHFDGLAPGVYSVTETQQPAGYADGYDTRGNVVPLPNSKGTDLIPGIGVVAGQVTGQNNFGEIAKTPNPQPQPDCPPAQVEGVTRLGIHRQPTRLVIKFSEPLEPASAQNLANYRLVVAFRNGKFGRAVPLKSAVYDPRTDTVTLTPEHRLNIHSHYQLTISNLINACGDTFDGNADGLPGGNYVTILTKANYPGPLPGGPARHVATTATWAARFPRLAASRAAHKSPRHG